MSNSKIKHIASFSGGKDSTAMVLKLIEEDWPLDEIVMFDTGWEFPQMYEHIAKFEKFIGRKITRLHPTESFDFTMCDKPIIRCKKSDPMHGKVYRHGNGWPRWNARWCTREKISVIDKYCGDAVRYIGIASDETKRIAEGSYPLVEWGITEADCLKMCYDNGFDFGGLYNHFSRVSCYCCPLKGLKDYRELRKNYPELWENMQIISDNVKSIYGRRFHNGKTVPELDARFAKEDEAENMQIKFDF